MFSERTAAERAMLTGLVAVAIVGMLADLGGGISHLFDRVQAAISQAVQP